MNKHYIAGPLIAAGLAATGLAPVASVSASHATTAAVDTCRLRLVSTKAVNLQHDAKGADQIRAALGNTIGRDRAYTLGQRRNTFSDADERFSGVATVRLQVRIRTASSGPSTPASSLARIVRATS